MSNILFLSFLAHSYWNYCLGQDLWHYEWSHWINRSIISIRLAKHLAFAFSCGLVLNATACTCVSRPNTHVLVSNERLEHLSCISSRLMIPHALCWGGVKNFVLAGPLWFELSLTKMDLSYCLLRVTTLFTQSTDASDDKDCRWYEHSALAFTSSHSLWFQFYHVVRRGLGSWTVSFSKLVFLRLRDTLSWIRTGILLS